MKNSGKQPNDKYAIRIYEGIKDFAKGPAVAPSMDLKGETPNHTEERLAGSYGSNPDASREVVNDWYSTGIAIRGNRAKNSTDESLFSVSHDAHYLAARGPILLFAMMAKHQNVIDTITKVWKGDTAAFNLVSSPDLSNYASPCGRLLDGSDQRNQVIGTFRWLQGKKIHQPQTLAIAPDWLGLYAFQLIEKAFQEKQPWASQWPDIKKEIASAKNGDVLPLKNEMIVESSEKGHVAYFKTFEKVSVTIGKWAWMDYSNPGEVIYGVDDPTVKSGMKGVKLEPAHQMRACPGAPSPVRLFSFPIAKGA